MLNENLKTLRKAKGFTQEDLAARLNVARQTVSKWEKGSSVPDSEMLISIAELFEVSVSDLLGTKIPDNAEQTDIARQLERINEQLAVRNRRSKLIVRAVVWGIIGLVALYIILISLSILFSAQLGGPETAITQTEYVLPAETP
ncbi:MAG: helix-turn-helix domain-containing protein [Clostridia bacterium]|nr:helix-turn-helix domain-containing protein [Clostridia bacterium]